jgi:hypothetical protein
MYMYYKWEKEAQKTNLEESGMTSNSKAIQILLDHFAEFVQHKHDPTSEGYFLLTRSLLVETYNRALFGSLSRNFEEIFMTRHLDNLVAALESRFEHKAVLQDTAILPLAFYVKEPPVIADPPLAMVRGLPFLTLGAYLLYSALKSN